MSTQYHQILSNGTCVRGRYTLAVGRRICQLSANQFWGIYKLFRGTAQYYQKIAARLQNTLIACTQDFTFKIPLIPQNSCSGIEFQSWLRHSLNAAKKCLYYMHSTWMDYIVLELSSTCLVATYNCMPTHK